MQKKLNIGLYIGKNDIDIAYWFNMLRKCGYTPVKWIIGIIAAYYMNKNIDIGTIKVVNTPIEKKSLSNSVEFNNINTQNNHDVILPQSYNNYNFRYLYGWHIKDTNGLYTIGSVIPISIYKKEIILIISKLCENNKIATFLKALIRKYLKKALYAQYPDINSLEYIMSEFILLNFNLNIETAQINLDNLTQKNYISNPLLDYI